MLTILGLISVAVISFINGKACAIGRVYLRICITQKTEDTICGNVQGWVTAGQLKSQAL